MKRLVIALVLVLMAFVSGCDKKEQAAEKPAAEAQTAGKEIKAGFIYVGPVGDAGWSYAHDLGRKEMEKLPYVQPSTYMESIPEGAEAARVITSLVQKGHNVIFTTSFGFMDPTLEVAEKYKDVVFMHCSGYKSADNMGTYFGRMYEPRYLSGMIAGKMTKTNVLGYVAAFPIPEVIRGINAFTLGARSVNPDVVVKVVWTSTWFDPGKEREAAEAVLDFGADVLAMHQDTPATPQAAQARGKYVIGYNSDMAHFAPDAFLTAPIWNWGAVYTKVAEEVHNGTWKSEQIWWGMEHDLVGLAPINSKVPADVVALVTEKTEAIKAGTFHPFAGPIKDQAGNVVVAEGQTPTDGELLSMNYFVEGVQGELSK